MNIRNIAWMGAGLLLAGVAGVAGAAVVRRRKEGRELPSEPKVSPEHLALREIMQKSAEYNDAVYQRVQKLSEMDDVSARPAVVAELTHQNQADRESINKLREALQKKLEAQGRTFMDVDGFVELISEYRRVTLDQQERHLTLFERVRKMDNVPPTPELHAYLKLGFKEDDQRWADTDRQLMNAANEQRELMLRAGRVLDSITDAGSAASAPEELNKLGNRYMELSSRIRLYREDDPKGAGHAVGELRTMYAGLLPMLKKHVERLRACDFYGSYPLREVLERMLPQG